jgi:hypothetical protein
MSISVDENLILLVRHLVLILIWPNHKILVLSIVILLIGVSLIILKEIHRILICIFVKNTLFLIVLVMLIRHLSKIYRGEYLLI